MPRSRLFKTVVLSCLVAVSCAIGVGTASAASLPTGTTALLSGGQSLFDALPAPVGEAMTSRSSVSANGRFVAFTSQSDALIDGDDDRVQNVYVKDAATGEVTLASRATGTNGQPARDDCYEAALSDNGSRVAFVCNGPLDPADTNGISDIYVRDLAAGVTFLVSRASGLGPVSDRSSYEPAISGTGEYVAFSTGATNLGDPDSRNYLRVYRRRIGGGDQTILVSRKAASLGGTPDYGSQPSISDDGNRIAYASYAAMIGTFDSNNTNDVYVYEVSTGLLTLASRASLTGPIGNDQSQMPSISGNGAFVAFESQARNLSGADTDSAQDIYRRTLSGGSDTVLISINAAGAKSGGSYQPSIDTSGNVVGFVTGRSTPPLDPADADGDLDGFVKNVSANQIQLVSRADGAAGPSGDGPTHRLAVSGDGGKVAFAQLGVTADADPRRTGVFLRDTGAGRTLSVARPDGDAPFRNQGGRTSGAAMSADGRYVAFLSEAPALGLPDGVLEGIFVRDRVTGDVVLASRDDLDTPFRTALERPSISADGRRVAFTAARPADDQPEVHVRDLETGRTFLASRPDGNGVAQANNGSADPVLDADGSRVAFSSNASNLNADDTDSFDDVFVRDLDSDRTILVSRADGLAGAKSNSYSDRPDLNADGTRVTFITEATNLGDGDTDTVLDVHLRDIDAGTTRLVSAAPGGPKINEGADSASIDASGTRIAFAARATNLLGATSPYTKVFVRDLAADTLVLASRADGADGAIADQGATTALISPDGGYVAFESTATNLVPGLAVDVQQQAYRRDLAAATTQLVSRRSGPDGAISAQRVRARDISDRGGCVTFTTRDGLVGQPANDYTQAYVRALRADCAAADPQPGDGGTAAVDDGGSSQSGPDVARDTLAPVLSDARLARRRFRVARAATALAAAAKRGTTLRFRSSEAGTLSVVVRRGSRRVGKLSRRIRAGRGRVALSGRLGRRALRPGRYRLVLTARDEAGNRSRAIGLRFRILPR